MRVLFLTHNYPRFPGDPAGSFLHQLALALRRIDIAVTVLAPAAPSLQRLTDVDGVRVERFRYAPKRVETLAYTGKMVESYRGSVSGKLAAASLLAAEVMAVRRVVAEARPDIVHSHWWFPSGLAAAIAHCGRPLVTTCHGTDIRLAVALRVAQPPLRFVVSRSVAVTTVSSWLARCLVAIAPQSRPIVAPMPVAVELFQPGAQARRRGSLLFVGRLSEQKGLHFLLHAMQALDDSITLDVVGDGPDRERLRALAHTLGVADRIRWHGARPQNELPPFYCSADVLVVPSIEEGLGLVAVEAQLCETPVVAFASGGLLDIVQDGVTGYLVPPGDQGALAQAITLAQRDPRRTEIVRNAREMALARYAPTAVAARYAEIYSRVLGGTV
jgi:glycosyltransferase involved in cell wall biosynthesis